MHQRIEAPVRHVLVGLQIPCRIEFFARCTPFPAAEPKKMPNLSAFRNIRIALPIPFFIEQIRLPEQTGIAILVHKLSAALQ
ncbi:hypothetical protein D3C71_1483030 [compost metagenome]